MSWLLPAKSSASVSAPSGPSKVYRFSTRSHGSSWRCALSSSRSRVNSFSRARCSLRAASHSSRDTIRWCCISVSSVPKMGGQLLGELLNDRGPSVLVLRARFAVRKALVDEDQLGLVSHRTKLDGHHGLAVAGGARAPGEHEALGTADLQVFAGVLHVPIPRAHHDPEPAAHPGVDLRHR